MATLEFKTHLQSNGQIAVPSDLAAQIPAGKELHLILSWETPVASDSLYTLGRRIREESPALESSVYDTLA